MKILYDPQIFLLQVYGGISLYHCKLMQEFCIDNQIEFELPVCYSENKYLNDLYCFNYKNFRPNNWINKQFSKYLKAKSIKLTESKLKKQEFDIYHPTYYANYSMDYSGKKPMVITVHDMTHEILPEYFIFDKMNKYTSKLKLNLIKKADKVIAISENTRNDILKITRINENKIELVHHGASFEAPETIPEYSNLPKKYLLFVGSRTKYKNFNTFINAVSPILKNDDTLKLVLAGGSSINAYENNLFKKLGISKSIHYIPNCDNLKLARLYTNALCFVYPSLYEGFGFPILEAFKFGCPAIVSNTSSFPEIAEDAAAYIDPYDEISIKNIVEKVLTDDNYRKILVNKGHEQVKKYSWNNTAMKTKEVYNKLL